MMHSRTYVKGLLGHAKKKNTVTYKGIAGSPTYTGSVREIDWNQFTQKEMRQISKMSLDKFPELKQGATQSLLIVTRKTKKIKPATPGSYAVGPESF